MSRRAGVVPAGAHPLRYLAYLVIATTLLLEVALRWSGFADRHVYDPVYQPFADSAEIPYVLKPNLVRARARGLAVIDTDALGLRTTRAGERLAPKTPGEVRIAVVGDSVTFGEGIPRTEDTFVQVLEDELNAAPGGAPVRVFNFGLSAYSVREMAATLEHRVPAIEPDLVLLALIPGDFRLSRTPGVDDVGHLVHREESWLQTPIVRDVVRAMHVPYLARELRKRLERWASGDPPFRSAERYAPESWHHVRRFRGAAERLGLPYLVVLLPQPRAEAWGSVRTRLAREGIAYVDLIHLVDDLADREFVASRFDPHPSPLVHRRIGRALAAHLQPFVGAAAGA